MFNKEMIRKHIDLYKRLYNEQHNSEPKGWFSYLRWLGSFTTAGNFNQEDIQLVKQLLGA